MECPVPKRWMLLTFFKNRDQICRLQIKTRSAVQQQTNLEDFAADHRKVQARSVNDASFPGINTMFPRSEDVAVFTPGRVNLIVPEAVLVNVSAALLSVITYLNI